MMVDNGFINILSDLKP